jgi:elongation factor 1 alpha-like protein
MLPQASFSWAWVLDERPEERSRGVTVDVAMARFATEKHSITLLDAPGHRDFVPNMISGAAQADAALLLVDGSPGGFEAGFTGDGGYGQYGGGGYGGGGFGAPVAGGQTKEHAQLARSLGVEQMAVVISKLDTCDYSEVSGSKVLVGSGSKVLVGSGSKVLVGSGSKVHEMSESKGHEAYTTLEGC